MTPKQMHVERTEETISIWLREEGSSLKPVEESSYECSVDLDRDGEVIGLEIEGIRHHFGAPALDELNVLSFPEDLANRKLTPEGREIIPYAENRPPIPPGAEAVPTPWLVLEERYDLAYICIAKDPEAANYEVSMPVNCKLLFNTHRQLCRVDIPLEALRNE